MRHGDPSITQPGTGCKGHCSAMEDGGEKVGKDKKPAGKLSCSTADTSSMEAAPEEK